MNKNFTPNYFYRIILFFFVLFGPLMMAQAGKDGALTVTTSNTVVNRYTRIQANIASGSTTVIVNNINELNRDGIGYLPTGYTTSSTGFASNVLEKGDLILLYQAQGAIIDQSNSINYGAVTNYNGAGSYEFAYVESVAGNIITLNCATTKAYTTTGYSQVIRVPQFTTLTVNSGASVVAMPWGSASFGGTSSSDATRRRGGFVALFANLVVNNGTIHANASGFRGGQIENDTSDHGDNFYTDFVTTSSNLSSEKGESIAGFGNDYDVIGGRFGRGAAANGGGGGNAHNAAGGGGANGGVLDGWFRGAGVMNDFGSCASPGAWTLDPNYIANGNSLTNSSGGGHGGYSFAFANNNACLVGPSYPANFISAGLPAANVLIAWTGDRRDAVGGLGGRPLITSNTNNQIFFGGGGGAGDMNNNASQDGGKGGGVVLLVVKEDITGSGAIQANGASALPTVSGHNDGAGGGGGGGAILVQSSSVVNSQEITANGGKGGDQLITDAESEGAGGGGGGGVISIAATGTDSSNKIVIGGKNGTTTSTSLTEFPANGATSGNVGVIVARTSVVVEQLVAPTTSAVTYCVGATATALTATGTNLLWYTAATGGTGSATAPTPSTATAGATTYYVTQTNANGCESPRASLLVTINALPAAPTVGTITQPTCAVATGSVVLTGLPSSGIWTINPGSITGTGTTRTITGLVAGTTYNFNVTNSLDCVSVASANVVVASNPNLGLDTDRDGIADACDLDNDNDGILDTVELNCSPNFVDLGQTFSPKTDNPGIVSSLYSFGGVNATFEYRLINTTNISPVISWAEGVKSAGPTIGVNGTYINVQPQNTDFQNGDFAEYTLTFSQPVQNLDFKWGGLDVDDRVDFSAVNGAVNVPLSVTDINLGANGIFTGQSVVSTVSIPNAANAPFNSVRVRASEPVTSITFKAGKNANNNVNVTMQLYELSYCVNLDSDGDGIPNHLDLDSDNDGCSDANEYYNNSTSANTNQQFGQTGGTVSSVNPNGTVSLAGATYSGNYANAIVVGSSSTISTNPSNQIASATGTANFSVVAIGGSGTTQYQWQLSTDSGSTWANIAGANSSALALTGITCSMNGNQYRVIITETSFVCAGVVSTAATLSVTNPIAFAVTGGGAYCSVGTGVAVGLANSESGVNYQLQIEGVNNGTAVAGTGSAISFGLKTVAGTYTVIATNAATGCTATMTGSVDVTVTTPPSAGTLGGAQDICTAGTTTLSSTAIGGTWTSNDAAVATVDASTGVVTGVGAGTATITYTVNGAGGCANAIVTRQINVASSPTTANAGPDQVANTTSFTLAANTPSIGLGTWSVLSGPSTSLSQFNSVTIPNAQFTPLVAGVYRLVWSIANGNCSSSDEVEISSSCVSNLIINGDFANAAIGNDKAIGWVKATTKGSYVETYSENTYFSNANSNYTAELDRDASLRQNVTVVPGVSYTLSFLYARRSASQAPSPSGVTIKVTGGSSDIISTGLSTTDSTPRIGTFTFTPTSASIGIEFYNHLATTQTYGTIIDDIVLIPTTQIRPVATTVPKGVFNTLTACAGTPIQLDVENLTGSGFTFAWTGSAGAVFSDVNIKNPTVTFVGSGLKTVSVTVTTSNGCSANSTTSINVIPSPSISTQPTIIPSNYCIGATANSLSVVASGSGLTYQWYSNISESNIGGSPIVGATNSSYTPSTATVGTRYYYCVVKNTCEVTSNVSGAIIVSATTITPTILVANLTYTSSPAGLTVGAGGVITGGTDGTSYTITATNGSNCSATTASFTYNGGAILATPAVPTVAVTAPTCSSAATNVLI